MKEAEKESVKQGYLRVSQVVLNTKEEADKIREMLNNGAHIGVLAYRYSVDPVSRETGGLTPFLDPSKREYAFINIVNNMKIGDISGVLRQGDKYFVLQRVN
jgi:parvulin-like peptidyl-prolyl isomerase